MNRGVIYGLLAYICWGVFPIYFKLLQTVPPLQILSHRIVWSVLFLGIVVALVSSGERVRSVFNNRRLVGIYSLAACLLAANWLIYIWGVNSGFIIETSLGYFINPLLNVLLGVVFLGERMRKWQWLPVGMATAGVIYLTISYGNLPWIALALAATFGLYGLIKKTAPLDSLTSLTVETIILAAPALIFLVGSAWAGVGKFSLQNPATSVLLAAAGVVTAVPLLLFGAAARQIPLSLLGLLQYIAPTGQFLLGVLIFHEEFSQSRVVGFGIIWAALFLFTAEGFLHRRRQQVSPTKIQPVVPGD